MFASLSEPACTDLLLRHAADQIERDQKEIAELKAKVEQYRALIPSWLIPMTPKDEGMTQDDFLEACDDVCRIFICPDCEHFDSEGAEDAMINLAAQALGVEPGRLRELAEADKDGRVIILPCKVYETDGARVYEHTVREVIYETAGGPAFDKNAIGKRIFLTRAEAERALAVADQGGE